MKVFPASEFCGVCYQTDNEATPPQQPRCFTKKHVPAHALTAHRSRLTAPSGEPGGVNEEPGGAIKVLGAA